MGKKRNSKSWNKNFNRVKMTCWNPWGLSNERLNYCKQLNFDILGLTELHNAQNKKKWKKKNWITSDDAKCDTNTNANFVAADLKQDVAETSTELRVTSDMA